VNVHPSKLEVRFEDEKSIYNFVLAVIRKSLGTHDLVPSMSFSGNDSEGEKIYFNPSIKLKGMISLTGRYLQVISNIQKQISATKT